MKTRDSQRSAVYAWENAAVPGMYAGEARSVEAVAEFVAPIWRAERGRYGLAKYPPPAIKGGRGAWGSTETLKLAPWARASDPVVLHEIAHALDGSKHYGRGRSGAHGPRFVGIYIGLLARHLGLDADVLMAQADERGIRYDVRAIGAVPVIHLADRLAKALPCTVIEGAVELGVSYRQVQGAALRLVRAGRARYWRGRIVPRAPA